MLCGKTLTCTVVAAQVLLEWCDLGGGELGGGEAQREWVNLSKSDVFKSVYVEKSLLWARRVLHNEQNRAVAWPARVSGGGLLE